MKPISYSAFKMYLECAEKYRLLYKENIKSLRHPSALWFGSYIDKQLNAIMENTSPENEPIPDNIQWDDRDFDIDVLSNDQVDRLLLFAQKHGYKGNDLVDLVKILINKDLTGEVLSDNQKLVLTRAVSESLKEKGALIVEAFQKEVLPKFTKINSVQTRVHRGVLDAEVQIGNEKYILDNKTSSSDYMDWELPYSIQFSAYGADKAIYVVFNKTIKKKKVKKCTTCQTETDSRHSTCNNEINGARCHGEFETTIWCSITPQILIGDIDPNFKKHTLEAFEQVEAGIRHNFFPKNPTACIKRYGFKTVKCPYFDYCINGNKNSVIIGRKK